MRDMVAAAPYVDASASAVTHSQIKNISSYPSPNELVMKLIIAVLVAFGKKEQDYWKLWKKFAGTDT